MSKRSISRNRGHESVHALIIHPVRAVVTPRWLLAALALAVLIGTLWLPFGLNRPDRMEGWVLLNHLDWQNSPISENVDGTGRPLLLTWFIAHWLDPDSFRGAHLVLMMAYRGKARSTCWCDIVRGSCPAPLLYYCLFIHQASGKISP